MRRIGLAVVLALNLTLAALAAEGQRARNIVPTIGILSPFGLSGSPTGAADPFRLGLRELGYIEGDNVRIEYRSSAGDDGRFPALARDLVALKVDVILASTVPAIRAAQQATTSIPIVMVLSSDPVRFGLVKSLGHPGGNTTGVASLTFDLAPKRLEVFKEAVPTLRQIAVLVNPTNPAVLEGLSLTEAAARTVGVAVRSFEIRQPADFDTAFTAIVRARADALLVIPDPLMGTHTARIVEFATRNRLPAMEARSAFPQSGGLISYGIDYGDHLRRAASYVDKILKGAKPADLPVEQPTKFELVINMKTAKALGLTIPQSVLLRADQLIE